MKKQMYLLSIIFLIVLFTAPFVRAENICSEIAKNPEVEAYFAEHRTKTLDIPKTKNTPARNLEITGDGGGSCHSDAVKFSENGKDKGRYSLECGSGNGCGFGEFLSIVEWKNEIYFLGESYEGEGFDRLNGWSKLSKTEQDVIRLRNLTNEIYLSSDDAVATSICGYSSQPYPKKSLSRAKVCSLLSKNTKSIFPYVSKDYTEALKIDSNPFSMQDGTYVFPIGIVVRDLNGDGIKEKVALGEGSGTGGCGCDVEGVVLLNDKNQSVVAKSDFENNFIKISQNIKCGDKMDIVKYNGQYYIEKTTRIGTREVFPLSGDGAFKPICTYVNNAPLKWN